MDTFPVLYTLSVGALAAVNPCGFAMLPAYLAYYLGTQEADFKTATPWVRGARALLSGAIVTLGFIILFGVAGALISSGARFLISWMPWIGLLIGLGLVLLGLSLLFGRRVGLPLLDGIYIRPRGGPWGMFVFGVAYALASLSCTLPLFFVAVGSAFVSEGILEGLFRFVAYGLGMGIVITALTLSAALFKGTLAIFLKRVIPYIERLSAALLVGAGIYIVYYWLTTGRLLLALF